MQSEANDEGNQRYDGRWLPEEHHLFLTSIMKNGKDWKIVEKEVKTRTGSQVRSHAQKFFIKLNNFSKERRKGKNWALINPQEIEQEILQLFTPSDITSETPKEIVTILNCDWDELKETFEQKKKLAIQKKEERRGRIQANDQPSEEEEHDELRNLMGPAKDGNDSNEQSYFIRILKSNKMHFLNGNDFANLFDLGNNISQVQEQSQTHHHRQPEKRQRAQSFSLPDQPNPDRLKETLDNLHKALGYEQ